MHLHVHTYMHTHTHTHTYMYVHTHTPYTHIHIHSVGGAILVSLSPSGENDDQESGFNAGALFALGGAVL